MTKYILHGGFTRIDNELNRTFYEEIVRDVPDGGTILLCYFASQEGDNLVNLPLREQGVSSVTLRGDLWSLPFHPPAGAGGFRWH